MFNIILLLISTLAYATSAEEKCDDGMVYYNGRCRQIFIDPYFENAEKSAKNILKTRANCADGERALRSDGVWKCYTIMKEPNCPEGQEWIDGKCDVWPANVVTVPPNCPPGQQWINDRCVEVWPQNIVTVPPNCPPGQVWIGGQCRDIWRSSDSSPCTNGLVIRGQCVCLRDILTKLLLGPSAKPIQDDIIMDAEVVNDFEEGVDTRRVINIPNQCPVGFRPDANGVCRPMF